MFSYFNNVSVNVRREKKINYEIVMQIYIIRGHGPLLNDGIKVHLVYPKKKGNTMISKVTIDTHRYVGHILSFCEYTFNRKKMIHTFQEMILVLQLRYQVEDFQYQR